MALIIGCFLFSCNEKGKYGFYDYSKLEHYYRIPILKPYSILSDDKGKTWMFQSEEYADYKYSAGYVYSIGVIDSNRVVVYSKRNSSNPPFYIWQVIDVHEKTGITLKSEEEYMDYLKNSHIGSVKLYSDFNALYKEFSEEKRLPSEWPYQPSK